MTTTRYLCPIGACRWFHDRPPADASALGPWQGDLESTVAETLRREAATIDAVIRAHCETHPLIEWIAEVQRERTRADGLFHALASVANTNIAVKLVAHAPGGQPDGDTITPHNAPYADSDKE
jgi:hypothetical protein